MAEEWDTLLGRSQDSTDLQSKEASSSAENHETSEEDSFRKRLEPSPAQAVGSSADSMRTMFSNSVTMPAGTLRELEACSVSSRGSEARTNHDQ